MEIWKDISGYEGKYQVSNLGRVKSLARTTIASGLPSGKRTVPERILSNRVLSTGYIEVALNTNGKQKHFLVHRLVAQAFIPNPENKREVNHTNGNKTDNKVENLEWATPKENTGHALDKGLKKRKLTEDDYQYIKDNYVYDSPEFCASSLAEKYGVHKRTIQKIADGTYSSLN